MQYWSFYSSQDDAIKALLIVVPVFLVVACQADQTGPLYPSRTAPALTSADADGPPPPRSFGPDSYSTGVFTGTGRHKLDCAATSTGGRVCDGFLRSSVDHTYLDARLEIPPGGGPFPLVTLIHGYAGSKRSSGDIAAELLADSYAVLRYSTRGFGDSWGQVNLADVNAEIGDMRSMIGEVIDEKDFNLDPSKVAVTGASYGGGHSWLALLDPVFETRKGNTVRIVAVAPIVPWTDLVYALLPNGRPRNSIDGIGGLKLSFVNGLYASGIRRNAARPYPNYPPYFVAWHGALNATEPNGFDPIWTQIVDGLAGYRSIWWQQDFWTTIAQNRVPIFQVQGFTDDLFPVPEAKRMLLALKSLDPAYPIVSYFGDLGHPRASNRPAEMRYVLDLIRSWLEVYLKGTGTLPEHEIYAARTTARGEAFSADVLKVDSWSELWTSTAIKSWDGSLASPLINPVTFDAGGATWDPLVMEGAEQLKPYLEPPPVPPFIATSNASYTVAAAELSGGGDLTISGEPRVTLDAVVVGHRVQLNVRLIDVSPTGVQNLITRGTYTIDAGLGAEIGATEIVIPTYGNYWRVPSDHTLRLEISNVDFPYIMPSREPSSTVITSVTLEIPKR